MSNELVIISDENKAIPGKQIILRNGLLDLFNNLDKINHFNPCLFISTSATLLSRK